MASGRPRKYKTKAELQVLIDVYFAECDPHWFEEEYWDYPCKEGTTTVLDYDKKPVLKKRMKLTEQEPYTMAGLGRRIGLSRQALMEYKRVEEFGDTIIEARERVGEYNEMMLHKGKNSAGAIFNLKVNFGYHEESEDNPPPQNPIVFVNNVPVAPQEPPNQT